MPAEVGAGLQLGPNAVTALRWLGAAALLEGRAVAPRAIELRRGNDGRKVGTIPLGTEMMARYGAPYWVVHRADLLAALVAAAAVEPLISIEYGRRITTFESVTEGVDVGMDMGGSARGSALIAADGVWSTVRRQVFPDITARPSGYVAYRTVVDAADAQDLGFGDTVTVLFATGAHLVSYPVSAGKAVNIVAIVSSGWRNEGWNAPAAAVDVIRALKPFAFAPALARLADRQPWLQWSLAAPTVLPRLATDRVAFVGDAGHAMLPFLAQGAAMALEDAVELSSALRPSSANLQSGLARYDERRRARACRVQLQSSRNGAIFHFSGPVGWVRDLAIGLETAVAPLNRWDWLYGWKPPT